jgi:hypothetical protein
VQHLKVKIGKPKSVMRVKVSATCPINIKVLMQIKGTYRVKTNPLRANYGNFDLSYMMLIQEKTHERWEDVQNS